MADGPTTLIGTVHGKRIELEHESGLPDGQRVSVTLTPTPASDKAIGAGLRASFGAWADDAEELDAFMEQLRQDRKRSRPEIPE